MSSSVTVEVLILSARDGMVRYRVKRAPLDGGHPDDVARALSNLTACTPGALLHSTSWRVEGGSVTLTYAALPDLETTATTQAVPLDATAASPHPLAPSPPQISHACVASHACRHLALLAATDDQIAATIRDQPDLWDPLLKLTPAPAGALTPVPLPLVPLP